MKRKILQRILISVTLFMSGIPCSLYAQDTFIITRGFIGGDAERIGIHNLSDPGSPPVLTGWGYSVFASVSWDGSKKAYFGYSPRGFYMSNIDDSDERLVYEFLVGDKLPTTFSLSPDGNQIAYATGCCSGGIYVIDLQQAVKRLIVSHGQLTGQLNWGSDYWPKWSSDGTKLVFQVQTHPTVSLYMVDISSDQPPVQITFPEEDLPTGHDDNRSYDGDFDWLQNSSRVLFQRVTRQGSGSSAIVRSIIYEMDMNDENLTKKVIYDDNSPSNASSHQPLYPRWSPSGDQIAVRRVVSDVPGLYVMNSTGGEFSLVYQVPTHIPGNYVISRVERWTKPLTEKEIQVNSSSDRINLEGSTNCNTGELIEINGEMVPECTLRAAIEALNNRNRSDSITFNIEGENAHIINLDSPMPIPEHPVVIDASTQPGYSGLPLISIIGNENIENGFTLEHGESVVRGFSIGGFTNTGILISGEGNNIIESNHIGIDATGSAALPNTTGIIVKNSADNQIGGPEPFQRNIISGNTDSRPDIKMEVERTGIGILIEGVSATNNHIQGNYIGTSYTGMQAVGNGLAGIYLYNAPQNLIGGNEDVSGNLISANGSENITIRGKEASGNIVAGNIIGTNASGEAALSENSTGVRITYGSNNKIGGITAIPGTAPGNMISGNSNTGVVIVGVNPEAANPEFAETVGIASGNVIEGNLIGTNKDGTTAISNNTGVVVALDAPKTRVGGSEAGSRNIISGNIEAGVILVDTTGGLSPHESIIAGNYIGTTISGNQPLGNGAPGIILSTLSESPDENTGISGVTIGGISAASRNVVAGNKSHQIEVSGPVSAGTVITNNYIGILQNGQSGQSPEESEYGILVKTDGAYIGEDMDENAGPNVIGGNQYGILLAGNMNLVGGGNKIGTNPGGTVAAPNYTGIWILGNGNAIIGNTISGNRNYGIMIGQEPGSPAFEGVLFEPESTIIARNMIGTNSQGSNAIGNGQGENGAGVMIWRGINPQLYLNTISGNHHGVHIDNSPFENTFMAGNIIGSGGIDPIDIEDGFVLPEFTSIPNQGDGVHITDGNVYMNDEPKIEPFSDQIVGNYIQNNLGAGIRRTGSNLSTDFEILSNFFFNNTGLAIDFEPEGAGTGNALHEPPIMMQPVIEEEIARIRGLSAVNGKIQLYSTPFCHPSGYGEGRLYLSGQDQTVTAGEAFFAEVTLPDNLSVGYYITALVTHNKRTSEFCKCIRIADKEKYQEQLLEELARDALKLGRLTIESNETKSLTTTSNINSLQEIEAVVYASEFNLPPDHSYFEGSAQATDGKEITPNTIDTTLYWTVGAVNVPDLTYNVCVDVSGTKFIQENQRMVLVHRNGIGSPWEPMDTSVDDNNILCVSGLTAFGDIAIASYDESVPTTIALLENQTESTKPITLLQNYPNPFAASTKIPFELTETGKVVVLIIDNLGRTVKSLVNQTLSAGKHEATFEGASMPEGMYFYQIRGNGFLETRKMVKTR